MNLAKKMHKNGFLPGPYKYKCNRTIFYIQHDTSSKTSGICFRCINNHSKLKYPIRMNSLFSKFPFIKLRDMSEIIYCFLCLDLNSKKVHTYLKENKNINLSMRTLLKVYVKLRDVINKYMKLIYESDKISTKNNRDYFSADESLINHKNNQQLWLIGIINNITKEFRIEASFNRDSNTL